MRLLKLLLAACHCLFVFIDMQAATPRLIFCGSASNDLYRLLKEKGVVLNNYDDPIAALAAAPSGSGVLITSAAYPLKGIVITAKMLQMASAKNLRLYIEYPSSLPGYDVETKPFAGRLERGVVSSDAFGPRLTRLSLLGINDCHVLPVKADDPLIVVAKVAGFDKAEYGTDDVDKYPALFKKNNMMVAMTNLSNFASGRYEPSASWGQVWNYILSWLTGVKNFYPGKLPSFVDPMYSKDEPLPADARKTAIANGADWFYKGRFLVHPDWQYRPFTHMRNYLQPQSESGPPLEPNLPMGDGSLGIMEGHTSNIYFDGKEQYRYWIRYDVQGEVAYALASSGKLLGRNQYAKVAGRLADFLYYNPHMLESARADTSSNLYGLIGWALFKPQSSVYYQDDNARATLGVIGASAYMNTDKWNKEIVENIMANFRTTGKYGFRGERLDQRQIDSAGWKAFWERDIVNPHPHFESWMWACYLWLYDKTKYKPLLEKTKTAIRMTMEAYPDKWGWTNGIQQERARMILPLAWLVRIEDTPEHRKWLDMVVSRLLENQDECGAIREELGVGKGMFGNTPTNKEYGLYEAPLIFKNGDPVSDMLYTSNFAFFSLNEAANATNNEKYRKAVLKLSDFLTRIQVKSDKYIDVDGAWFRAFDYNRWDYWASNADIGWGAWSTLTGWIQSWIVATQVLVQEQSSYWEKTRSSTVNSYMPEITEIMFREK